MHELVNKYWVQRHRSVANFCREEFRKKRLPDSEYFELTDKDLEDLQKILKEYETKTTKASRKYRDERWIENLKSRRKEYYASSRYKKFRLRHANTIAAGYMIPIGCFVMFPLFGLLAKILEAFGLNQYYIIVPVFAFYFCVLWINQKNDRYNRKELLEEENTLIKEHIDTWKRIDANTDAYKEKTDELKKYSKLRDKGVITEEEFQSKKKKLLDL